MIINYDDCIINLDKLSYVMIVKYEVSYEKRWRVEVTMADGKGFSWKGYKTSADAQARLDDFFQKIERTQYRITELIP